MFRFIPVTVILALLVAAGASRATHAQDLVEVEHFVWTDNVDRSTREAARIYKSPIREREIYFWTRLKGSRDLLEQLRTSTDGFIRVRHLWQRYDSDQLLAVADVPLNVGRKEDLRKLGYEVDALGFFRWTVWSYVRPLTRGHWRVDVVYGESYEPVMCVSGDITKPCFFAIEVK